MTASINWREALVVDDDQLACTVLADTLKDLGVPRVVMTLGGQQALDVLSRHSFALVVCDLNMPGCDGFQFMEQLAERHYPGAVLLLSGMGPRVVNSATLMAKFHGLKIVGSLSKPVNRDELRSALNHAIA